MSPGEAHLRRKRTYFPNDLSWFFNWFSLDEVGKLPYLAGQIENYAYLHINLCESRKNHTK